MSGRGRARQSARRLGVNVTVFTQSIGANLLTNGDFSDSTGTFPNGWSFVLGTSGGNPGVSNSAGAALFTSTATANSPYLNQNILGNGSWYEVDFSLSTYTSGSFRIEAGGASGLAGSATFTSTGSRRLLMRGGGTGFAIRSIGSAPHSFVVDDVSVKLITLNAVYAGLTNGTHTLTFSLPVSPVRGERIELRYRQQDSANYWAACLIRNDANTAWDFQLNSVSAGASTNRISVTGVGSVDALRVVTSGDSHTASTGSSGTFTSRGSVSNSTHAGERGVTEIHHSTFTPLLLTSV